ncbi:MAG: hypothetical protein ACFFCS_08965 [Candidatus Hodarchaeota archaeon]
MTYKGENFREIAPGLILVGQFGWLDTGVWLFHHESECFILEMPDYDAEDGKPRAWDLVRQYIEENNLHPKFISATHNHLDHFYCYPEFHDLFPSVPIIVHPSFFPREHVGKCVQPCFLEGGGTLGNAKPSVIVKNVPFYCYDGNLFETHLASEPLFVLHVPKHSRSDQMFVFRGSIISGDWWIGERDPNPNRVPVSIIQDSISFLQDFCKERNYVINNLFSVHANEFRRSINFHELMEETRKLKS